MTNAALTIALRLADPDLADRVMTPLGRVTGITLVGGVEPADMVLSDDGLNDGDDDVTRRLEVGSGFGQPDGADCTTVALTPREREVVALLAEGLSNKQVALRLGIAPDTARFHVGRLIDKLAASGRTDAVAQAARRGIVKL